MKLIPIPKEKYQEYKELKELTESIDRETRAAEEFLNQNLEFAKPLKLSIKIQKEIKSMENYNPNKHVRLMRYDFHPTKEGWAVSEVNSDVPGGFAEATTQTNSIVHDRYCRSGRIHHSGREFHSSVRSGSMGHFSSSSGFGIGGGGGGGGH